jgi:hypothetical protein
MKKLKEFRTFQWLVKMEDLSWNIIQMLPIVGIENLFPEYNQAEGCAYSLLLKKSLSFTWCSKKG